MCKIMVVESSVLKFRTSRFKVKYLEVYRQIAARVVFNRLQVTERF